MPYNQGLSRVQGDPGFFGFIGSALKTVAKVLPGPIGIGVGAIGSVLSPQKRPSVATPGFVGGPVPFQAPSTGFTSSGGGGRGTAQVVAEVRADGTVCPKKKRRRIDPLNPKALRRANTRQRSFLRAVDRTLASMPTKGQVTKRRAKIRGAIS